MLYGREEGSLDMRPLKLEVHRNMEPDAQRNLEILVEYNVTCLGGKCRGRPPRSDSAQSPGGRSGSHHSCFVRGSFPSSGAHNLEKGVVAWPLTRLRNAGYIPVGVEVEGRVLPRETIHHTLQRPYQQRPPQQKESI